MYIKARIGWQALKKDEYMETGDFYLITGTDIDESRHIVDLSRCFYVSEERYDMDKKIQLQNGDIIVTKDGTIGKVAMVTDLDKPATLNSHLFVLRDLSGHLDKYFLLTILSSDIFKSFVESTKTGSTLTGLPQKTIVKFKFQIPSIQEQRKISTLFKSVDSLIALHQRKLDKLKRIKSAYLTEMFPAEGEREPKRRFSGYTGAWEQQKLSQLTVEVGTGKSKYDIHNNGIYPILGSTSVIGYDNNFDYSGNFILTARVGANAGNLYRFSGLVKITDNTVFIKSKYNDFLYYYLQKFDLKRLSFGTGQPLVKASELKNIKILKPKLDEEVHRISNLLLNIDTLIALHQRKLDKLKKLKAAYLNEMFV